LSTAGSSKRGVRTAVVGGLAVVALVVAIVLATAAGGSSSGGYHVYAIFDDAGNLVSSENIKIDGVNVGTVGTVAPTPEGKVAVTLNIENPGFQDFRTDASCTIEPQALIGEKFVNCLPFQAHPEGAPLPPPLKRIPAGREGAGEYLLPVANTSSPVGVDLLNDINHLPQNERLAIILNELGTGLAGRGSDLNAVLHRSNPALRELEQVIAMLASENKVLGNLAEEGSRALEPLAADRREFADFFAQANTVATASARHRTEVAEDLHELPVFVRELGPYLKRLDALAEQATPTFTALQAAAPGINRTFANFGPFTTSTTQYFKVLGGASKGIGGSLVATQPLLHQLESLGTAVKPFAGNLSALLSSFRATGGIERLMDFIFLGTNAANGYNSLGHFVRAGVVDADCVSYNVAPRPGCEANFIGGSATAARASGSASASDTSLSMERIAALARGASVAQAIAEYPGSEEEASPFGGGGAAAPAGASAVAHPVGGAAGGTTYYTPGAGAEAGGLLLNYLLGE
jgi:phospholipid/cholesterol/gamma-HCH transport system substrate-binding protein